MFYFQLLEYAQGDLYDFLKYKLFFWKSMILAEELGQLTSQIP